jgi:GPI mannosyltransferase 1 subunit M
VLWAGLERRAVWCGVLLGLGVHVKIYPFVYASALWWWFGDAGKGVLEELKGAMREPLGLINRDRVVLVAASAGTFMGLNAAMYLL